MQHSLYRLFGQRHKMSTSKSIIECTQCPLHHNQSPKVNSFVGSDVMIVGLSAKRMKSHERPLDSSTISGQLILSIIKKNSNLLFYKTNLVKCLPLSEEKRLRYPIIDEKRACYHNFEYEIDTIDPRIILLLGKQVTDFISKNMGILNMKFPSLIEYNPHIHNNRQYIAIHHPAYIQVYKRRNIEQYINTINKILADAFVS